MAVTQKVTLYNNKFTVPPVINAVQNDTDRQVEACFGDFTLQVGMTGVLSFIRSDRTHYEVSATLDTATNTATAELDQALTQAGVTQAQLKITDSGNVGSTFTFMIKVQPDVAGISVQQDGWSAQEFDQRLTDAENAIDAVEEDVEDLQDKEYDYAPVITDTASGAIATFPDGADGVPVKDLSVAVTAVQSGSGDPSPDNVRPISGWSEAKVTRTGKNLLKLSESEMESNGWNRLFPISVKAGTYILSCENKFGKDGSEGAAVSFRDENNNNIGNSLSAYTFGDSVFVGTAQTFTTEQAAKIKKINFGMRTGNTTFDEISKGNIQLELGSTATDYEPYNGATYTISLGDTRYGCMLDVRRGKLRVDRVMHAFNGTENWTKSSSYRGSFYCPWGTIPSGSGISYGAFICSHVGYVPNFSEYAYGKCASDTALNLWVMQDPDATVNDLKAFLAEQYANGTPVTICYTLATTIEVDLTPTEITTLLGENNIWADCGDIDLTYCADTKRYIQKVISQLA